MDSTAGAAIVRIRRAQPLARTQKPLSQHRIAGDRPGNVLMTDAADSAFRLADLLSGQLRPREEEFGRSQ